MQPMAFSIGAFVIRLNTAGIFVQAALFQICCRLLPGAFPCCVVYGADHPPSQPPAPAGHVPQPFQAAGIRESFKLPRYESCCRNPKNVGSIARLLS